MGTIYRLQMAAIIDRLYSVRSVLTEGSVARYDLDCAIAALVMPAMTDVEVEIPTTAEIEELAREAA
jgi:hypothetical protein